jgi:CRP/FNR family transcriptional regulator, cyclic AMP receptor protein
MMRALRDEPDVSGAFISYLLHRSNRTQDDIVDHLFNSSEKRLARLLMRLASYSKDGKLGPHHGKTGQEALAEMIGTTRSRISFFMNKFRRLGYSGDTRDLQVYPSLYSVLVEDDAHLRYTEEARAKPPRAPKRPVRR